MIVRHCRWIFGIWLVMSFCSFCMNTVKHKFSWMCSKDTQYEQLQLGEIRIHQVGMLSVRIDFQNFPISICMIRLYVGYTAKSFEGNLRSHLLRWAMQCSFTRVWNINFQDFVFKVNWFEIIQHMIATVDTDPRTSSQPNSGIKGISTAGFWIKKCCHSLGW